MYIIDKIAGILNIERIIKNIKRIENLESKDKLSDNNKAYWFYVKNLKEEIINFKDISLSNKALLSLIDEETLKEEVKNIATYISNEIVKNMEI